MAAVARADLRTAWALDKGDPRAAEAQAHPCWLGLAASMNELHPKENPRPIGSKNGAYRAQQI